MGKSNTGADAVQVVYEAVLSRIADRYVRLALAIGQHDPDYVDAYFGDPAWKPTGAPQPLGAILEEARSARSALHDAGEPPTADPLLPLRFVYLDRQLSAAEARIEMLLGARLPFDEESRRLYDAVSPHKTEAEFQTVLDVLDGLLPGAGPLVDRYATFRAAFVIPTDRLDHVFRTAIDASRRRTIAHLTLPPDETFTVEYVTGKAWSAYNWFKGSATSVIQVNTDLPVTIDRALDLACHEGYPGHHVYQSLLEQTLVRDRGWIEFAIYPLFSPQSLISEGTANFGIEVAFPADDRVAFERDVLYPAAGLDPAAAGTFTTVQRLIDQLTYAGNEAARRYLDGEIDRAEAIAWLARWAMMPADRAEQRIRFFDQYRSYVINYNVGLDLVRAYVERRGGTPDRPDVRWREFEALLLSPRVPSGLL